ncbi:type III restriction endonuclease subunit R [Salmonella enterica subsp. enterica serovar Nima]|uniref:Type III restriction endonuclease subunit R n=1 Tax=Salmonella enterica subsp. enterica serovar Nima TaxID=940233 RepID=A0A5I3I0Y8_SALET|nr:type III restriction endonuclease subunit R [Salmonella enterica subsp. enterica serovar Nima]ECC3261891.1 type III restriction endonuclease subunit R [Salmonella enterica subsp. enterica]EBY7923435.1 type III restriction endonuclease subunit R [Salmonella enterica subsp. enterica serovar Nima]ECF3328250.1 type III restriction endonuclease subunit R [Salmonella enterica subsp. enterica serovar Nima]ECF4650826.1 type III restriction endonuclease subunit R [Salmonella enterica subsp. enterica 
MAKKPTTGKAIKKQTNSKLSFHKQLVLNRFMFRFFKDGTLHGLKIRLGEDRFEGIHEDGQSLFFHELSNYLFEVDLIDLDELRRYDLNIVKHWQQITEHRNLKEDTVLNMKYFQYLSLLFTEIYLDWYFNRKQELLDGLNSELNIYNAENNETAKDRANQFKSYILDDLNKLAYWNATGSGKTLLLHVNILQYLHYYQNGNTHHYPDKIILLTPDERLSQQHLDELYNSGFSHIQLFDKNKSAPFKGTVEVIDINKLADDMGDKTVAVEAFEGNNLVLIDEGHKGTGTAAGAWMRRRDKLTRDGFAFEYSATFGQAVSGGNNVEAVEAEIKKKKAKLLFETTALGKLTAEQLEKLELTSEELRDARIQATREVYGKSILFDYSYKFFYEDGYGKESLILNLNPNEDKKDERRYEYFTACLLSFYQQQYLFNKNKDKLGEFNIEKPLWVFVGNTVSGEDSDIHAVLRFLAWFLNNEVQAKSWIRDLVENKARILDTKDRNIFEKRFTALINGPEDIYLDILARLFNTTHSGQRLRVLNLIGSKGELALQVGEAEPFGLINIGDSPSLYKMCEEDTTFDYQRDDFAKSLFHTLNDKDSQLHILIGSRKFTEGWSSWRVSTMGLLNMGRGEGSQIIQLFGRGVRLKGRNYSLKRSTPGERPKGLHLEKLETLNIFGVRADYMATFKQYLEDEGITPSDEILELNFETRPNMPNTKLKTLKLKDGYKDNQKNGFKRVYFPELYEVPAELQGKIKHPHIKLDLYPKLESIDTSRKGDNTPVNVRNEAKLDYKVISAFDFDRLYLAIQTYKLQRGWSNLRLDKQRLIDFCLGKANIANNWYTLSIPASELEIKQYSDIAKQEDIMLRLLTDYTDRFYNALKNAYEGQFYEITQVNEDDPCMIKMYHFEIEESDDGLDYTKRLEQLQQIVAQGDIGKAKSWNAPGMIAVTFDKHLYYPLLSIEKNADLPLKMRPTAFDAPSEITFIKDLQEFIETPKGQKTIGNKSLYLLRNADSKAKGLGFATAGNFYPDFLLWLVDDESGKQWLSLIDPKGIRNLNLDDAKFGLYKEIKELEKKLSDDKLSLSAFIISETRFVDLINVSEPKDKIEERNVLFIEDTGSIYLEKLFKKMVA